MIVGNHQSILNQSKPQFQLELSLAQFSPSLFYFCVVFNLSSMLRGLTCQKKIVLSEEVWLRQITHADKSTDTQSEILTLYNSYQCDYLTSYLLSIPGLSLPSPSLYPLDNPGDVQWYAIHCYYHNNQKNIHGTRFLMGQFWQFCFIIFSSIAFKYPGSIYLLESLQ